MKDIHLISLLHDLEAAAVTLQGSLLARDTDGIWKNIDRQERLLERLGDLQRDASVDLDSEISGTPEARRLLRRGLTVVQANRALSQRFLEVVGQTLGRLGGGGTTYSGQGVERRAPVLVRQQG